MRLLVHQDGDGLVLRRDQRHLLGQMPLHHVLPLVNQDRVRILHPHLHRHLNGVVAPPQGVVHHILVQRLFAAVGHLPALPADEKLHHVAVLGHFDAVMVGPLVEFEVSLGAQVGIALEEPGNVPLPLHVFMFSHACPPSACTMASSAARACGAFFAPRRRPVCVRIACGAISAIAAKRDRCQISRSSSSPRNSYQRLLTASSQRQSAHA